MGLSANNQERRKKAADFRDGWADDVDVSSTLVDVSPADESPGLGKLRWNAVISDGLPVEG